MRLNKSVKLNYYLTGVIVNVSLIMFIVLCLLASFENNQEHYEVGCIIFAILLLFLDFIFFKIRKNMLSNIFIEDSSIKVTYFRKINKKILIFDIKTIVFIKDTLYLSSEVEAELNAKNVINILKSSNTISFRVLCDRVKIVLEKIAVDEVFFVKNAVSNIDKNIYSQVVQLGRKIVII